MSTRGLGFAAMLVLLALLLVEIAGLRYWLQQHDPSTGQADIPEESAAIEPLLQEQLGQVVELPEPATPTALIERPLFTPTRRPPPPPEEATEEPEEVEEEEPPPELDVTLRSIVMEPDSARIWVQPAGEERRVQLREGDTFDGWTLTSVKPDAAVFTSEDHSRNVSLRPQRSRQLEIERVSPQPTAPPLP